MILWGPAYLGVIKGNIERINEGRDWAKVLNYRSQSQRKKTFEKEGVENKSKLERNL